MRRTLLVLLLLVTPALAGCTVPSGVNEDAYRHVPPPRDGDAVVDPAWSAFAVAMAESSRPRPPVPGEDAYDRYLENATRWATDGLPGGPEPSGNASDPARAHVLNALGELRNATRGSDKEQKARELARTALALDAPLKDADENTTAAAERLAQTALEEVAHANASVHAMRADVAAPGVHAFMRAQAVLGLALSEAARVEAALAADRAAGAAMSALGARVSAASVHFWLDEAAAAGAGAPPVDAFTNATRLAGYRASTVQGLSEAERLLAAVPEDDALARAAAQDLAGGVAFVRVLLDAGLPEGAWAASQGLDENLLVLSVALSRAIPEAEDVRAAWDAAEGNVRSYRDAQRYDTALALTAEAADAYGVRARLDLLRAFAAIELMDEISGTRESWLLDA